MPSSIKSKLALGWIFSVAGSLVLMGVFSYVLMTDALKVTQDERLGILARQLTLEVKNKLKSMERLILRVEPLNPRQPYGSEALVRQMAEFGEDFPILSYINESGQEKLTLVNKVPSADMDNHGAASWFKRAINSPDVPVFSGPVTRNGIKGDFLLVAVAHGQYPGYRFEGVVAGWIPLRQLTDELQEQVRGTSRFISLVDAEGRVIFTSYAEAEKRGEEKIETSQLRTDKGFSRGEILGVDAFTAWDRVSPLGWSLLVSWPYEHFMVVPNRMLRGFLLVFVISAGLCTWVYLGLAAPLTRRQQKVLGHIRGLIQGDLKKPLDLQTGDELQEFAMAINTLAASLDTSKSALQDLQLAVMNPLVVTDGHLNIIRVNEAFEELIGAKAQALLDISLPALFADSTPFSSAEGIWSGLKGGAFRNCKTAFKTLEGENFPVVFSCLKIEGSALEPGGVIGIFIDQSLHHVSLKELEHLVHYDALTNLPNRSLLLNLLEQAVRRGLRDYADRKERLGVMYINMDRFSTINTALGHDIGDRLLKSIAERLQKSLRRSDIIGFNTEDQTMARLGGDEFVILLSSLKYREDAGLVARKLIELLIAPFHIDEHELFVSASIGISLFPDDGVEAQTLFKKADVAMYQAKAEGKNNFRYFYADINNTFTRSLKMEHNLRTSIDDEFTGFSIAYQPKVCALDGHVSGAEALLRWHDPDFGDVGPAELIPLAEETGLIMPLGEWVLMQVCTQLAAWRSAGLPLVRIAVNISGRQFEKPGLAEMVEECLVRSEMDPAFLELELTESVLMRAVDRNIEKMHALKNLGLTLALDDFGTGYSSLNYLRRFPVDVLKIDRSFILEIETDSQEVAIVRATIEMAKGLGMKVVAEGIETQGQLAALGNLGCDDIQGYFTGRPMPPEDFAALIATGRLPEYQAESHSPPILAAKDGDLKESSIEDVDPPAPA